MLVNFTTVHPVTGKHDTVTISEGLAYRLVSIAYRDGLCQQKVIITSTT